MIPVSDTYRVLGAAYAAKGYWSGVSLHRELRRRAELHPETRMTFIQPAAAVEVTAADAVQRADRLAAALHARGWRPGDVLALQVPHSPENLYAILAGLRLGLQLVPIVPIYGAAELGFILRQTRARGLGRVLNWA